MRIGINVSFEGRFFNAPDRLMESIRTQTFECLTLGQESILRALQVATPIGVSGALSKGWAVVHERHDMSVTLTNSQEYFLAVEKGRRAAPVPIRPLALWVQRKLGKSPDESVGIAIAISRKKALNPTPGQHFASKTLNKIMPGMARWMTEKIGTSIQMELNQ